MIYQNSNIIKATTILALISNLIKLEKHSHKIGYQATHNSFNNKNSKIRLQRSVHHVFCQTRIWLDQVHMLDQQQIQMFIQINSKKIMLDSQLQLQTYPQLKDQVQLPMW
jgi:hypothetical protein